MADEGGTRSKSCRDPEAIQFILDFTRGAIPQQLRDVEALDSKIIQVFSVAAVVIALGGLSVKTESLTIAALLISATVAFGVAALAAVYALLPRSYKGGHFIEWLWSEAREEGVESLREQVAGELPKSFQTNAAVIGAKALATRTALVATTIEVACLAAALIVAHFP